jgi:multidrug efflux system membrane fusion protein
MNSYRHFRSSLLTKIGLGVLLSGIVVFAACAGKKEQKPVSMSVPVTIAVAQQRNVPLQVNAIGSVVAYNTVGIKSQVNGEITSVNFKEGDDVRKGQLLFTIDPRPMEADLRRVEATLTKDKATAANDQAQAKRYAALLKEGVVAQQQADQMIAQADASDALVKADEAAVQNARVQLQYTKIYAPISGRTGNLLVQLGNIVKANPDNPIVTINQVTPIYVNFSVPEQFLAEVKRYNAQHKLGVTAVVPSDPVPATGALSFIDNQVNQQTGTILLKGTFTNADRRLWPGQFVNVSLTLANQLNAIIVPSRAIQTGQQGTYVFAIKDDNTAEMRPVKVDRAIGDDSVVSSGIKPGDRVVTDGQLRLVAGAKVDIRNVPTGTPGSQNAQQPQASDKTQQALRQD